MSAVYIVIHLFTYIAVFVRVPDTHKNQSNANRLVSISFATGAQDFLPEYQAARGWNNFRASYCHLASVMRKVREWIKNAKVVCRYIISYNSQA